MKKSGSLLLVLLLMFGMLLGISYAKEPVTLHIMHWNRLGQNVIDKFEKDNPGIKIQFELFPVDKFIQVIKTRIAADEVPDILGAQEVDFRNYIKQGVYMDLSKEGFLKNYYPGAVAELKDFSGVGKVYSVPTNAFALGLWTNRDLFDKNGIKIPSNAVELADAAAKLKAKGIAPFVQGVKDGWPIQQDMFPLFALQVQKPDYYQKMKTGEHKWTDPEVKAAFQKWAALFDTKGYLIQGSLGLTYEQAYQVFEQGKAAMWPMGSWATEFMKDKDGNAKKLPFKLEFVPFPSNNPGEQRVLPGTYIGAMYAISAHTKHPVEAKKFITWLTKPENAAVYAGGNGVLFPVKGLNFGKVVPYGDVVSKTVFGSKILRPFNMTVDASIEKQLTVALQNIAMGNPVDPELAEMQKVQEIANRERK